MARNLSPSQWEKGKAWAMNLDGKTPLAPTIKSMMAMHLDDMDDPMTPWVSKSVESGAAVVLP